jgi:hypothetical protein
MSLTWQLIAAAKVPAPAALRSVNRAAWQSRAAAPLSSPMVRSPRSPKVLDHRNAGLGPCAVRDPLDHVDAQCVGYLDLIGITAAAAGLGVVLAGDVLGKFFLSRCAVAFKAACADGALAVPDVPDGGSAFGFEESKSWSLGWTRHAVFIPSMSLSVV